MLEAFWKWLFPQRINSAGLNLIRHFEGLRLMHYQDVNGAWKIGYGCPQGNSADVITQARAEKLLKRTVSIYEEIVRQDLTRDINSNQFSALVSLCFNVGGFRFSASRLLELVNAGDFQGAALEFTRWDHIGQSVSQNLLERREAEKALFLYE